MDWQATELNSAWKVCFMALVRDDKLYLQYPELIEKSIKQWNEKMLLLNQILSDKRDCICG